MHLASRLRNEPQSITIDIATDDGLKSCLVHLDPSSPEAQVHSELGSATQPRPVVVSLSDRPIHLHATEIGNPHAVVLNPPRDLSFEQVAPILATHPSFPNGANISFASHLAQLADPNGPKIELQVRVWERGVGPTLACGTAACAVAAVAVHSRLATPGCPIPIHLPGGTLHATTTSDLRVSLAGPARRVFQGVVDLRDFLS